jgi:hypothetical protein
MEGEGMNMRKGFREIKDGEMYTHILTRKDQVLPVTRVNGSIRWSVEVPTCEPNVTETCFVDVLRDVGAIAGYLVEQEPFHATFQAAPFKVDPRAVPINWVNYSDEAVEVCIPVPAILNIDATKNYLVTVEEVKE